MGSKAQLGMVKVEESHIGKPRREGRSRRDDARKHHSSSKGGAVAGIANAVGGLFRRSKVLGVLAVVAVVIASCSLVDFGLNHARIYNGVYVGDIDLSGATIEEAQSLIENRYQSSLESRRIIVFADEEAAATVDIDEQIEQDDALAEQVSVEESRENKQLWWTNADLLGASLPARQLAEEAFAVGRENGGFIKRIRAGIAHWNIDVRASYDEDAVESLAHEIDLTVGNPRVDYGIAIDGGVASVTEGHDGYMMDRDWLYGQLNSAFFGDNAGNDATFIAQTEYAPLRIEADQAQFACDYVNTLLASSISFSYGSQTWEANASDYESWITTEVVERGKGHELNVLLDESNAKPSLLANVHRSTTGEEIRIDFEEQEDGVIVLTDGTIEVPQLGNAIALLDSLMFSDYRKQVDLDELLGSEQKSDQGQVVGTQYRIVITDGLAPETMSFDEALDYGLITEVSTYTTEYVNSSSTQNRLHNIHLAADIISNSVVESGGGTWSFNERVGECTADAGFLGAGAIVSGQYDDAIGGGICQVATTVFNSVYEGGYPVVRRYNHTLYIASYPTGRDAAIAYPDMDLVWRNDSTSDVLMRCSYTDTTLTVTLYSVDQGYVVISEEGEWTEGEKHKTKTVVDESAKPGSSYVETAGYDGRSIVVYRTVKDASGSILIEDAFHSTYSAVTEVIVKGPDIVEDSQQSATDASAA